MYLFNKRIVHMMDDIFWLMGFKSAESAKKVKFFAFSDYSCYCDYSDYSYYIYRLELKRAFQMNNGMGAARTSQSQSTIVETISDKFLETHGKSTSKHTSHTIIMHSSKNHHSKWICCKSQNRTLEKHGACLPGC